jgi:hypothetical protein
MWSEPADLWCTAKLGAWPAQVPQALAGPRRSTSGRPGLGGRLPMFSRPNSDGNARHGCMGHGDLVAGCTGDPRSPPHTHGPTRSWHEQGPPAATARGELEGPACGTAASGTRTEGRRCCSSEYASFLAVAVHRHRDCLSPSPVQATAICPIARRHAGLHHPSLQPLHNWHFRRRAGLGTRAAGARDLSPTRPARRPPSRATPPWAAGGSPATAGEWPAGRPAGRPRIRC